MLHGPFRRFPARAVTVFLTSKFTKRQVLCGFLACYGGFLTLATLIPPVVELVYMIGFVVGFGMVGPAPAPLSSATRPPPRW